jgi:hypothetical protein
VLVIYVVFHEHYFDFNVSVASPINCDVGALVSFLNLAYNEYIIDVSLKIHRVLLFFVFDYIDVGIGEGGVRSSGDGVGFKTNHSRLVDEKLGEDEEELLQVETHG